MTDNAKWIISAFARSLALGPPRRHVTIGILSATVAAAMNSSTAAAEADLMSMFSSPRAQALFPDDRRFSGWLPIEFGAASHLFVVASVHGAPVSAIVDSGAARTVIDRQVANRLQIQTRAGFLAKGVGGTTQGGFADHLTVRLGDLELSGIEAGVLDLSMFSAAMGRPVDLVIGRELFELVMVDLDFSKTRIGLYGLDASPRLSVAVQLPLLDDGRGRRNVPLSFGAGRTAVACYDLGSDVALLVSPDFASEQRLLARLRVSSVASVGVGGAGLGAVAVLPEVAIGRIRLNDVPVQVPSTWRQSVPVLAGLPIWSRFRNVIDYSRSRLSLFADANSISAPFAKDRSGIGATRSNDRLRIVHLAEGSPAAAAGLREGDEIITIDGHIVDTAYLATHPRVGERPAGTLVALGLSDGRNVELVLADYY